MNQVIFPDTSTFMKHFFQTEERKFWKFNMLLSVNTHLAKFTSKDSDNIILSGQQEIKSLKGSSKKYIFFQNNLSMTNDEPK